MHKQKYLKKDITLSITMKNHNHSFGQNDHNSPQHKIIHHNAE